MNAMNYQSQYPINLSEVVITYQDSSTLECAALYDSRVEGGITLNVFLDSILQSILSGDHRDVFKVPGTDTEITRSLIRSIAVTVLEMTG